MSSYIFVKTGLWLTIQDWLFVLSGFAMGIFSITVSVFLRKTFRNINYPHPVLKELLFLVVIFIAVSGCNFVNSSINSLFTIQHFNWSLKIFIVVIFCASGIVLYRILYILPVLINLFKPGSEKDFQSKKSVTSNSANKAKPSEFTLKETQIRESEERFRLLVESAPYAIVLTDDLGDIRLVNRQTEVVFGYERSELIGKSVEILLPVKYRSMHVNFRHSYYRDSQTRPMGSGRDLHGLHKLGNEIPVEIGLAPLQMQGKLMVIATIVDIRERRKNEEQILQKNKELAKFNEELKMRTAQLIQSEKMSALGTLIAGVAHELNNPITGILNYSQYCKKNVDQDSKIATVLDDLIFETKRCEEIVKNLLQYSYSHEPLHKDTINGTLLEQTIKRVCTLFAHELKNIKLRLFIDHALPGFQITINKLQQIISNLIKNAIDAMETSGEKELTLRAYSDNTHCHLVIEDTGEGIDEENILRIFDPFYTTKDVGKGTGLGLTVTKSIIEENNGEITVVSLKNKGTQFHVKFPNITG